MKLKEVLMKLTVITRCRGAIQTFGPTRSSRDATRTKCRNTVRSDAHSVLHALTLFAFPPANVAFSRRRACLPVFAHCTFTDLSLKGQKCKRDCRLQRLVGKGDLFSGTRMPRFQ